MASAGQRVYNGLTAEERRAQRRTQLLKAARGLLADGGAKALTVTGVCQAARLSERYFYESFANRAALIDALFEDVIATAVDALDRASSAGGTPHDRAARLVEGLLAFLLAEPRLSILATDSHSSEVVARGRAVTAAALAEEIAARADLFWPDVTDRAAARLAGELAIGGLADVLSAWHVERVRWPQDELVERATTFFLGIGTALAAPSVAPAR
ncbi:TetR family transcriptional regulator [Patulibacter brassicae]|uniref:TetR family transcriptional regulator n=1 Tax=Patulibacter brassicae TaxID=1705717 RepID=A0ABU4VNZ7_9ACTN|nr:TetR family transcriptional regulator [Patulibacter brassicae]MDX8152583.1 TetR family transcriptional regulator [Patulibacter brassicae]